MSRVLGFLVSPSKSTEFGVVRRHRDLGLEGSKDKLREEWTTITLQTSQHVCIIKDTSLTMSHVLRLHCKVWRWSSRSEGCFHLWVLSSSTLGSAGIRVDNPCDSYSITDGDFGALRVPSQVRKPNGQTTLGYSRSLCMQSHWQPLSRSLVGNKGPWKLSLQEVQKAQ